MRRSTLYVRIWRIKTVLALKGLRRRCSTSWEKSRIQSGTSQKAATLSREKAPHSWLAPLPFTPEFGVRFPDSAVWKKLKMFLPHPRVKVSIVGSLRDREVTCSASDRQGSNFESCVWRAVSSQSSHHPQEVLLAQFSLYVHKGGLNPDSFHFIKTTRQWMHDCLKAFNRQV